MSLKGLILGLGVSILLWVGIIWVFSTYPVWGVACILCVIIVLAHPSRRA